MLHISSNQQKSVMEPHSSHAIPHKIRNLARKYVIPTNIISCVILAFEVWQKYQYSDMTEPKMWGSIIPSSKLLFTAGAHSVPQTYQPNSRVCYEFSCLQSTATS